MMKRYKDRLEYNQKKDSYLVKREDAEALFQMMCKCLFDLDYKTETEGDLYEMRDKFIVRLEHQRTLEKVIEILGMNRNYIDYFTAYRKDVA